MRLSSATTFARTPRCHLCPSNPCDAHALDTLMQQATQGHQMSLELHQVPRAGACLVGPNERPCSIAAASPSCAAKSSIVSATVPQSQCPRLPRNRLGSRASALRRPVCCGLARTLTGFYSGPAVIDPLILFDFTMARTWLPKPGISWSPPVCSQQLGAQPRRPRLRTMRTTKPFNGRSTTHPTDATRMAFGSLQWFLADTPGAGEIPHATWSV